MRTYPFRTPGILPQIFSNFLWKVAPCEEQVLYLTFDDGPTPEATPYVLDLLDQFEAKATFFVVGENVERYPDLYDRLLAQGHRVGNHTQHHISGWSTSVNTYEQDVALCGAAIGEAGSGSQVPLLFRPPFGQITLKKANLLRKQYRIVMWSLLSGDFDQKLNLSAALQALDRAQPGDIIVFHDSAKSLSNLKQLLPSFLERFHRKGYKFAAL